MTISISHGESLNRATSVISALASELRINIILRLSERDYVVHELVTALNKSQPLVSQHLRVLKEAGLVTSKRSGREVAYSLASPQVTELIDLASRTVGPQAAPPH